MKKLSHGKMVSKIEKTRYRFWGKYLHSLYSPKGLCQIYKEQIEQIKDSY